MKKKKTERAPRTKVARPAAAAITDALRLNGIDDKVRAHRLVTEWFELVGERIAAKTRPAGITDRTLVIEVATSPWMQELTMMREPLLAGLLQRLGEPRMFTDLKFRLAGRSKTQSIPPRPIRRPPPPVKVPIPATGLARETIVKEVASIEDEELRELVARVRITHSK